MKALALVAAIAVSLGGILPARAATKAEDALERPVTVEWSGVQLSACLKYLAKRGNVKIEADSRLPDSVRRTPVTYAGERVPLGVALGHALRAAGLRYAVTDEGVIVVSTPNLLAKKIVYGGMEHLPESEPMDLAGALNVLSDRERDEEEAFTLGDPAYTIDCRPHRYQERPRHNPDTGLTDYPAPPIWMLGDDDVNNARFRYSRDPYFPMPEEIVRRDEPAMTEREVFAYVVRLMRSNPKVFRQVVKALQEGSD